MSILRSAARELERMVTGRTINHGGHPVMRYMVERCRADTDWNERIRPSRKNSADKIDGVIALCNAIDRALVNQEEPEVQFFASHN